MTRAVPRRMRWAYVYDPTRPRPNSAAAVAMVVARRAGWRVAMYYRTDAPGLLVAVWRPRGSQRRWLQRGTVRMELARRGFMRQEPGPHQAEAWTWVTPDLSPYMDELSRGINKLATLSVRFGS